MNFYIKVYRQLHQRKKNYEIYKYLKQQLSSKSKEIKDLKETYQHLRQVKREVIIYFKWITWNFVLQFPKF